MSDPYRQLGVPRSASPRQIKAAHRELAKRYHPDSPTADAQRFLRVQEAYQLLTDPLRRREWDARHTPAPVRADEPTPASGRPRQRRAPPAGREQQARSYTWSASEVPWWEEGGRRTQRPGPAGADAEATAGPTATGRHRRRGGTDEEPRAADEQPRADFDVYNRSSGAAWSAAARAYFRRADQELPRRGSFHYQGSQPLTAARARAAAEDDARRRTVNEARGNGAAPGASVGTAPPGAAPPVARHAWTAPSPEAGVVRDVEHIAEVRARIPRERAARWPSRFQRVLYTLVAWVPLAFLVGYGGPLAGGCAPAAGECPEQVVLAQALIAATLLAVLYALPKLAYGAALATTLLAVGGGLLLLAAWLLRLPAPQLATLPPAALLVGVAVLGMAYLLAGVWLAADRERRPWAAVGLGR